jgi:hypothetical protein
LPRAATITGTGVCSSAWVRRADDACTSAGSGRFRRSRRPAPTQKCSDAVSRITHRTSGCEHASIAAASSTLSRCDIALRPSGRASVTDMTPGDVNSRRTHGASVALIDSASYLTCRPSCE